MRVNGSWYAYRSGSKVYARIDLSINMKSSKNKTNANYGLGIHWNGTLKKEINDWIDARWGTVYGPLTNYINETFEIADDNSAGSVEVVGYCYRQGAAERDSCTEGYPHHGLSSYSIGPGYHNLAAITVSGTDITKHNVDRTVSVSGNGNYPKESSKLEVKIGSGSLATYTGETSGYEKTITFRPSGYSVSDASSYNVTATRYHVSSSFGSKSGSKTFYTYRQPVVNSLSITPNTTYSPQDKLALSWSTNGYRWGSYEVNFVTSGKFNNSSIDNISQNPTGISGLAAVTHTLTESDIYSKLTNTQLNSYNSFNTDITIKRTNTKAGNWSAESTKTVTCQIQPVLAPSSVAASGGDSSANRFGTTIYIQEVPILTLDWGYSKYNGAAGVVDGYKVEVFLDDTYNDLYSTFDVELDNGHLTSSWSGTLGIDTANDLKRGVKNYFKITPYYKRPNGNILYGTQSYTNATTGWVIPIYKLDAPNIEYPINNSVWHNKYWRILMESPIDRDMSSYDVSTQENYIYKDIEIEVIADNTTYDLFYSDNIHNKIFSTNTLTYQKKIGVNLSLLSNFINANKYKFRIRYRKNYYGDVWGIWSDYINVDNVAVTNLSLRAGQQITAQQYMYVHDASMRLYNTYPFSSIITTYNVEQVAGDQIDTTEYQGIYDTVKGIQLGINNYCVYDNDRINVSMTNIINEMDSPNNPKQEFITAEENPNNIEGRNYKNILIDCMNKLV